MTEEPTRAAFHPQARFLPAGDGGLVVELGDAIDPELNAAVVALDARVQAAAIPGVLETVPTYRSLLVLYDPVAIRAKDLKARIGAFLAEPAAAPGPVRRWSIPVAYGGDFGIDLDFVAQSRGLTPDRVIALHSAPEYRVYMIGFAPGFAYLGGLPEALATSRRADARPRTPAGTISVGGVQTAVSSIEVPSAWNLLGRTPVRTYDPRREEPFLLKTGDRVRLLAISPDEFKSLEARGEAGEVCASWSWT